jgi:hypothetical protein
MRRTWNFVLRELVGTSAKWTCHGSRVENCAERVCSKSRIHTIEYNVSSQCEVHLGLDSICESVKNKDVAERGFVMSVCFISRVDSIEKIKWNEKVDRFFVAVSSSCHWESSLDDRRETEFHLDVDRCRFHVSRELFGRIDGEFFSSQKLVRGFVLLHLHEHRH